MARGRFVWRMHPCKKFWSVIRGGLWWEGSHNRGTTVVNIFNSDTML